MILLWVAAALIFVGMKVVKPELVAIKPKSVLAFVKVLAIVTIIRTALIWSGTIDISAAKSALAEVDWLHLSMVYWEDVFFTLPILYWASQGVTKWVTIPYAILASAVFASGHLYQGVEWSLMTLFYVPLISYRYSLRVGLGTVACCHILYDLTTAFTMRLFS